MRCRRDRLWWAHALTGFIALIGSTHAASANPSAGGDAPAAAARPWRGSIGAGGYLALTGPSRRGALAVAELSPGWGGSRLGARVEARSLDPDGAESGMVTLGLTHQAAAARPRLALGLHAEAGLALPDPRPVAGGGVHTQLWVIGPLALGLDSTATLLLDGLDTELVLASAVLIELAR
jgi:hypothetical protein